MNTGKYGQQYMYFSSEPHSTCKQRIHALMRFHVLLIHAINRDLNAMQRDFVFLRLSHLFPVSMVLSQTQWGADDCPNPYMAKFKTKILDTFELKLIATEILMSP